MKVVPEPTSTTFSAGKQPSRRRLGPPPVAPEQDNEFAVGDRIRLHPEGLCGTVREVRWVEGDPYYGCDFDDGTSGGVFNERDITKEDPMHYRNGRAAKNGDKVVQLSESYTSASHSDLVRITGFGILFDAKPGGDFCNGSIAPLLGGPVVGACLCDCLHVDDLAAILAEKGLDKRAAK